MAGNNHYQRCASAIWKVTKAGNTAVVNRVFGTLDNEHNIENILYICRGDLKLVYTTLETKPTIFAHINNADLVKKLGEQDRHAHPNCDGNDDEINSSLW